jgi:hypothetical protein|tara:strand:+ start:255 stop:821 length:567 start_codon:yes stop_codon:yes gene_type:complete
MSIDGQGIEITKLKEIRCGVVSHPRFQVHQPPSFIQLFLKGLRWGFKDCQNKDLVICVGDNRRGMDEYILSKWRRFGLQKPPIIFDMDWDIDNHIDNHIDRREKKLGMYMNLVEGVDFIVYFTHPTNPSINSFGYVIEKECERLNKPYIQVPIVSYDRDEVLDWCVKVVKMLEDKSSEKNLKNLGGFF